jgi:small subunit ribosomal protein S8
MHRLPVGNHLKCRTQELNLLLQILSQEGYIGDVQKTGTDPKSTIKIALRYNGSSSVITGVKRVSKPGLRLYVNKHMIPTVVGGMGIAILSTPQGIMTGTLARKKGIGGELLATIW